MARGSNSLDGFQSAHQLNEVKRKGLLPRPPTDGRTGDDPLSPLSSPPPQPHGIVCVWVVNERWVHRWFGDVPRYGWEKKSDESPVDEVDASAVRASSDTPDYRWLVSPAGSLLWLLPGGSGRLWEAVGGCGRPGGGKPREWEVVGGSGR